MAAVDEPIRWFPPIDPTAADSEFSGGDGVSQMPLFPLGASYLPYTEPVLNIFEPRYRQMYNDILFSGSRRFCVVNVDEATGRLAEAGVVFYLEDLKEVSEQTQDRVKYVGSHKVIGRVTLRRVLNPSAAASRETYLKAEVAELVDSESEADSAEEEAALKEMFCAIVESQKALNEEPRFTDAVKADLNFTKGSGDDDTGLWGTIQLWQQFLEQRTAVLAHKMQREIQKGVQEYLKENGDQLRKGLVNSRGEMRMEDLPADLVTQIREIQARCGRDAAGVQLADKSAALCPLGAPRPRATSLPRATAPSTCHISSTCQARYREELEALDADPHGTQFQRILQTDSHAVRWPR